MRARRESGNDVVNLGSEECFDGDFANGEMIRTGTDGAPCRKSASNFWNVGCRRINEGSESDIVY